MKQRTDNLRLQRKANSSISSMVQLIVNHLTKKSLVGFKVLTAVVIGSSTYILGFNAV
jgi:hypothetical protein